MTELGPREDELSAIINGLKSIDGFGDFHPVCLVRLLQTIVTLMWGDSAIILIGKNLGISDILTKIKDAVHDDDAKALVRDIVGMTTAT